ASDENLDSVEINGEIASTTDEGNFSQELQLKKGTNRIDVSAVDTVGNTETKIIVVTVEEEVVLPVIENLLPSTDQALTPGDKVKISFKSNALGGEAYYEIKLPANISTQSSTKVPMKEVEDGKYEGTWTAPNLNLKGAVIEVGLTD
ncbi:hypothetical protein J4G37_49690, partial [Microvirga sp. 3-52]|nr:hypothetical protein [Microvirga sp. 3-52]